jgi:hypothetical protein
MHRRAILAGVPALVLGGTVLGRAAWAQEGPKLSVTIYNADLALVQDTRLLTLAAGRQKIEFKDVSSSIRPETVTLAAPGVGIVEQNFDYDLLSPDKMMEKAVGQQVKIVRTNPGNGQQTIDTATVLAVNDGVVLQIGDHIEVLRDDGVPTRVIFDKVPENLRAQPTLSVTVDVAKAGPRIATLSYLTRGLSWKADYVALFDEKAGRLDLQGWITLANTSGTAFVNADTQLVAGNVNLSNGMGRVEPQGAVRRNGAGTESNAQKSVADYYVYPLAERTTLAQNQTKQVSFLDVKDVQASKLYQYSSDAFVSEDNPTSVNSVVSFANSGGGGLGAQLPAGVVRIYMRDTTGEPKFIGENQIGHTPQGSQLAIVIGEAFDITVQPTVVKTERRGDHKVRYSMSYTVRNAKDAPVTVELVQGGLLRDGAVVAESQPSRRLSASRLAYDVAVPAHGETRLTFTVDTGW